MDYSRKYKKYKLKYLNLRETMTGGDYGKPTSRPSKSPSDMLVYLMDNNGKFDENVFSSYILNYMKAVMHAQDFLKADDIPFYIPLVSAFHKYNRDPYRAQEFDDLMVGFLGFVDTFGDANVKGYWNDIIMKRKVGDTIIYPKQYTPPVQIKSPTKPLPIPQSPSNVPGKPLPIPQSPPNVPGKPVPKAPWESAETTTTTTNRLAVPIIGSRRMSTGQ